MSQKEKFCVLVAEDDLFQRLALLDFMSTCKFNTVEAENGRIALDEMRKPENDFDLVLLDLMMPEMNGYDVLEAMKNDPKLSEIPVVVMSATDSQQAVSHCLQLGATDYLVKPIRMQECRALTQKMKHRRQPQTLADPDQLTGLAKYEKIRPLGQGAAGCVSLSKNVLEEGKEYALKEIDLYNMNQKDKKAAHGEVTFLKVLKGPTIIKFYENFTHGNSIFIVMEYCSKGNLDQLIQRRIQSRSKFSTDQILRTLAHIVMAVMAMHNKNILHRDIKTQNIFITENGICKLGDFGISRKLHNSDAKAMTSCGTPYFMPPEVCLGKPYDGKADVWAIGVVLYELIMLKKPFRGEAVQNVLQQITKNTFEPLSEDVDSDLKMLVVALLNKDYNKRPSIFQVANFPAVKNQILAFIDENNIEHEVLEIIDLINSDQGSDSDEGLGQGEEAKVVKDNGERRGAAQIEDYQLQNLEEWAYIMHKDIKMQDYKNGWFGKHTMCCRGEEIHNWLTDRVSPEKKKVLMICQKMLEQDIIQNVENKTFFGQNDLYRFQFLSNEGADNLIRTWREEPGDAYEVSAQLIDLVEEMYAHAIITDEDDDKVLDVEIAIKSTEYQAFIKAVCELQKISLASLNPSKRVAFFINIYQCMYVHMFFKMISEGRQITSECSVLSKLQSYMSSKSSKTFYYNIAGEDFTIDDIKHGMLRGNTAKPGHIMRVLNQSDSKTKILPRWIQRDPRINFICLDFPDFVEHIQVIVGENQEELYDSLNTFVGEIINAKVTINVVYGEFAVPKLMETYKEDFGGTDENLLEFIYQYYDNPEIEMNRAFQQIAEKSLWIVPLV